MYTDDLISHHNTRMDRQSLRAAGEILRTSLLNKKHLGRDSIIIGAIVFVLVVFFIVREHPVSFSFTLPSLLPEKSAPEIAEEEMPRELSEEEAVQREERDVARIQSHFDTFAWTPYQNTWYGFLLKYPETWSAPFVQKAPHGVLWEQKVHFMKNQTDERNPFEGVEIVIYPIAKVRELSKTDEFPKLKYADMSTQSDCAIIDGHLLETGDYPAEEVYVPANDVCYNAALFFTNARDPYIYIIVPKLKEGSGIVGDPAQAIAIYLPEFYAIVSAWSLIDIQRPKPVPSKPRIAAPGPASYKVVGGRKVCEKSNDRPSKSKQNKGRHMDMECCLDPDEYPNPHCYYPQEKYGKYLP